MLGLVRTVAPSRGDEFLFELVEGATLVVPAYDDYWCYYLLGWRQYEPELVSFFHKLRSWDATVIDCGSNVGFWPALLSSSAFGARTCIAVEASKRSAEFLRRTAAANGNRFTVIEGAVAPTADQWFLDESAPHAARQLSAAAHGSAIVVDAIALDDLIRMATETSDKVIVKLDIEGFEPDVIRNSQLLTEHACVILYEEHGRYRPGDATSALAEKGFQTFAIDSRGRLSPVLPDGVIDMVRRMPRKGLNFVGLPEPSESIIENLEFSK